MMKHIAALAVVGVSIALTGCNSGDKPGASNQKAGSVWSAAKEGTTASPSNSSELFADARYIAATAVKSAPDGLLARGSLYQQETRNSMEAVSDLKTNDKWPSLVRLLDSTANAGTFTALPPVQMSSSLGTFVSFFLVSKDMREIVAVGIDMKTKRSAILQEKGTQDEITGDMLAASSLWAARSYLMVSENEKAGWPPKESDDSIKWMAVGALHGIEHATKPRMQSNTTSDAGQGESTGEGRIELNNATDPTGLATLFFGQVIAAASGNPMKIDDTLRLLVTGAIADTIKGQLTDQTFKDAFKDAAIESIENGEGQWSGRTLPGSITKVWVKTVDRQSGTYSKFCIAMAALKDAEFNYIREPSYIFCDTPAGEQKFKEWRSEVKFSERRATN